MRRYLRSRNSPASSFCLRRHLSWFPGVEVRHAVAVLGVAEEAN